MNLTVYGYCESWRLGKQIDRQTSIFPTQLSVGFWKSSWTYLYPKLSRRRSQKSVENGSEVVKCRKADGRMPRSSLNQLQLPADIWNMLSLNYIASSWHPPPAVWTASPTIESTEGVDDHWGVSRKHVFSCPEQLNRWPCHWLTDSLTD